MEIIETFKVVLDFEVSVDPQSGEITTKCVKKTIDKKGFSSTELKPKKKSSKKEESSEPTLILEDNKYTLNQAAIDLMGIDGLDVKIDIKYKKVGKELKPIIGTEDSFGIKGGNKLTKSHTVACRGSKHDELEQYGTEFILIPFASEEGQFILTNKNAQIEKALDDTEEPIDIENELEEDIEEVLDIQDLIDNPDVTEIPSSLFQL